MPAERLRLHQLLTGDARAAFAADVRRSLQAQPKQLFPKYFYDELGSQLFDAICLLPEYYLTRAENEILTRYADEIVQELDDRNLSLIEMGSGSALKTRLIIEALLKRQSELLYIPVDISASALETSSRVLLQSYPALRIEAYASLLTNAQKGNVSLVHYGVDSHLRRVDNPHIAGSRTELIALLDLTSIATTPD